MEQSQSLLLQIVEEILLALGLGETVLDLCRKRFFAGRVRFLKFSDAFYTYMHVYI